MEIGNKVRCIKEGSWEVIASPDGKELAGPRPNPGGILTVKDVSKMDDGLPIVLFEEMPVCDDGVPNWFTQRRFEVIS